MNERPQLIVVAGGGPVLATLAAAQERIGRVGMLTWCDAGLYHQVTRAGFIAGLREQGYIECKNLELIQRSADFDPNRFKPLTRELVQAKVDVVFAPATLVATAAWYGVTQGAPIVILGGVHVGCFKLFGGAGVHSVRDLKGRTVAVTSQYLFLASISASVGVDPQRQGLSPALYFCCLVAANREFAQRYPVATLRALRAILKPPTSARAIPRSVSRPSSRSVITPTPSTRGRRSATCRTAAGASTTPRRPCASTRCGCVRPGWSRPRRS